MSITRVHYAGPLKEGHILNLDPAASRHVLQSLRMRLGDSVTLFNGEGGEFHGRLTGATKEAAQVTLDRFWADNRASSRSIVLAQALLPSDPMDLVIQKAVELGVSTIQPLICRRSVVRLAGDKALRRLAHWERIAVSACEQCGLNLIPEIRPIVDLPSFLAGLPADALKLTGVPLAEEAAPMPEKATENILILVGPEGGLAPEESLVAADSGFIGWNLGPRILRAETAAIALVAAAQMRWGDLR